MRAQLRAEWGTPKAADRDASIVASYHRALGQPAIDERTWRDLDLDAVFAFLDRTESVVGRQVLYDRLRVTQPSLTGRDAFESLVELLRNDEHARIDVQLALRPLAPNNTNWLWSLAVEPIDPLPRWAVVYPTFASAMAALVVLGITVNPSLLVFAVFGLVGGVALRAAFGRRLVPLAEPFAAMVRLLTVARRMGGLQRLPAPVRQRLVEPLPSLRRLRRWAGWLAGAHTGGGDLASLAIEYVNLLFCLDANAAMVGVRELRRHQDELHEVFRAVGEIDAAMSVASVRAGAADTRWCRPDFLADGAQATFEECRHPLVADAVPNSLTLGPPAGLLVTGANMTGKSTFLRTIGVNVVLAQAIDTAFASLYRAPNLSVASCITPTDDLQAGKSYYQVEVETLVAMLRGTPAHGGRLYLFDELFRGTNTLDRIGAASAVLAFLVRTPDALVIAATHDLELTTLLSDYQVVHFGDRLTPEGLQFDYVLRPGPTTTRNAIALLGVLGAPPEVVSDALARTERLRSAKSG